MAFVLDNSVSMAWCFEDEGTAYTDRVLDHLDETYAIVPALWLLEASNALLTATKRGRISAPKARALLDGLLDLPIRLGTAMAVRDTARVLALAQDCQLSSYDAAYVDMAMRSGLPLATQDQAMTRAARHLGIAVFGES